VHTGWAVGRLISLEGDTLSSNVEFDDNYLGSISGPRISLITDSTVVFVYSKFTEIFGQLTDDSLRFIGEKKILVTETTQHDVCSLVRVASNPEYPNLMVVWRLQQQDSRQLLGRLFRRDLTPIDTSFVITEIDNVTSCWSPEVLIKSNGNFIVTFTARFTDSVYNVYYREYNHNGVPLSGCIRINEGQETNGPDIDTAIDNEDNVIIVWDDTLPDVSQYLRIVGQRIAPDGTMIGGNFQISQLPEEHSHYFPSVDMRNGNVYTVWNSTSDSIWANSIDFTNPPAMNNILTSYILNQNYPNPFNSSTTIKFSIPNSSFVSLTIFDLRGRLIDTLTEKQCEAEEYEFQWNPQSLPSGIYLYRLEAGEYVETRKMLLVE
jgi:hypothetical protein